MLLVWIQPWVFVRSYASLKVRKCERISMLDDKGKLKCSRIYTVYVIDLVCGLYSVKHVQFFFLHVYG